MLGDPIFNVIDDKPLRSTSVGSLIDQDSKCKNSPHTFFSELRQSIWAKNSKCFSPTANTDAVALRSNRVVPSQDRITPCRSEHFQGQSLFYQPSRTARNLRRMVVIESLKPSCLISQVLDQVRGGIVVEAILMNTVPITGFQSALVTFFKEQSAIAFVQYIEIHTVKIEGQPITAKLLPTPTWPMTLTLKRAVREHHHTRCLQVQVFPRTISPSMLRMELEAFSSLKYDSVEHMQLNAEGNLVLRFCSVVAAQRAFDKLSAMLKNRGCRIEYISDPCAQSIRDDQDDL